MILLHKKEILKLINLGSDDIVIEDNDWTITTLDRKPSAHFEHTIAVHNGITEILSSFAEIEQIENN